MQTKDSKYYLVKNDNYKNKKMGEINIITLQPLEWEKYRAIRLCALKEEPQAFASTYEENLHKPSEMWAERLTQALEGKNQWLYFAEQNGNLVGMAGAFMRENESIPEVIAVYVTREARGQGVAKKLMMTLISAIKENSLIHILHLEVNTKQTAAIELYKKCGFIIIKTKANTLGDGIVHEDYLMELALKP